jgi:SAM-dependent methyltransferase
VSDQRKDLDFTGERFTPECVREIWYEHWHRYVFARGFAAGKRVLDAACGEGYGSALLADVAAEVVGVDIDEASVLHARERYASRSNVRYEHADATKLSFADHSFDLVVSFETLEHLAAQEHLVAGFARVLNPSGILLISSPDKRNYTELAGFRNEFHVRELYREELLALLEPHFPHVRLYGQKLLFQSVLWAMDLRLGAAEIVTASHDGATVDGLDYPPMYYVAVCSREPLPDTLPALALFGDREESLYAHYNHEIRKNMSAGARIAELEAEVRQLHERAATASHSAPPRGISRWWRRNRSTE